MRLGIAWNTAYHGTDGPHVAELAARAEDLGFESFFASEHIVFYPGATIGPFEVPTTMAVADPLETLAFVAASTERLVLGTAVLLLPYHHPVVLAKRLATLDALSRGRMRLFTVGLGSLPGEAAALGVDFAGRGKRADEAIDVLRLLWSGGPDGVPVLPIHVGGSSRAAARRAGTRGDGWFPGGRMSAAVRAQLWALVRREAVSAARDPDVLSYTRWGSTDMDADDLGALAATGVDRVVVSPGSTELREQVGELTSFVRRVKGA